MLSNRDLKIQIDKNHAEIKDSLKDITSKLDKIAPVLENHEVRLKQAEKDYDGLVGKMWAVAIVAIVALLGALIDTFKAIVTGSWKT